MAETALPLASMMPATGILPYYFSEASKLTTAPEVYHLASIVTAMGAMLDPVACAYLMRDGLFRRERLFLWMLLVGPSGNKKTYTSDLALEATGKYTESRMRSPEGGRKALDEMLQDEPNPILHIREAASWFANNRQAYMVEGAAFWSGAYDGYYTPRNAAGRTAKKRIRVGVSLLAMGPESEIIRAVKRPDWMSGLLPRINVCKAGQRRKGRGGAAWPPAVLARIQAALNRMVTVARSAYYIRVTREARKLWDKWTDELEEYLAGRSEIHESIGSRLSWHVLRIATIFACSRFSTVVEREDVEAACLFGRYLRDSAMSLDPGN